MRSILNSIVFLILLLSCNPVVSKRINDPEKITFQQKDKEILNQAFNELNSEKNASIDELTLKVGLFFIETPYAERTLEIEPEHLVVNLREMDCTTFAENCLAIARTIKSGEPSFDQFVLELKNIRYRDGKINGYPSRLHYFSDWIFDNHQKKLVSNISKEIANIQFPLNINFMSTHSESYKQLSNSSSFITTIAEQEKEISGRKMYYIPKGKIIEIEDKLSDGDIVGITTNLNGLDIQHVAILIIRNKQIHLLHASSAANKVIISDETLENYLKNSKSATGIMIARPVN